MEQLIKKYIIKTEIEVITGMHIGGNSDTVEIGGIDNPVIKISTRKNQPYIPGSSLKGKMRSLLEQIRGKAKIGGSDEVNDLFGFASKEKTNIAKLIVRDGYLTSAAVTLLEENEELLDMPYTENKYENTIDRTTGVTVGGGIRQTERVPAGSVFDVEFVINVWDNEEDGQKSLQLLKEGMKALELDYLGGSGSRGYGKVKFNWDMIEKYETMDMQKLMEDE